MAYRVTILLLSILTAQCCVSAAKKCAMDIVRVDALLQPLFAQVEVLKEQLTTAKQLCSCSEDVRVCRERPMGMEDGGIPDSRITASSEYNFGHRPQRARLNTQGSASCWIAHPDDSEAWIQVDFQKKVYMTGVITQGRNDEEQWMREYQVAFSEDGSTWTNVVDAEGAIITFTGNTDRNTEVTNRFPTTLNARYLRIYPTAWNVIGSMRFEVIGCASLVLRQEN